MIGVGAFGFLLGTISHSVSAAGIPPALRRGLGTVGAGSVATPAGYITFVFLPLLLWVSVLAICQVAAVSLTAAVTIWAGAHTAGVEIAFGQLALGGGNCLSIGLLFLGFGSLLYALVPRAGVAPAYAAVIAAFIWKLLGAPRWLTDLTPFAHVGLVPAQPFRPGWALAMVLVGAACAGAALLAIGRRDLRVG